MFEVIKLDIRIIEETKRKYLDMLTTKIFLNKEEVVGLTQGSGKRIIVICPFCGKQRIQRYVDSTAAGHTLCCSCSKSIKSVIPLLGLKKGRLLPFDFGEHYDDGIRSYYKIKAICDCGVIKDYVAGVFRGVYNVSSCGCLHKEIVKARVGELSATWNPELSEEDRRRQNGREHEVKKWARAVKQRDSFTCQVCGSEEKLIAHHLNNYADNPDLRYSLENGITLCRDCHTDFHVNFMGNFRSPCTEEDFEYYKSQM